MDVTTDKFMAATVKIEKQRRLRHFCSDSSLFPLAHINTVQRQVTE
ncbi:MAG: hypothetical protein HOJ62_16395 [Planctomycetaceae bacterium]|nr:hypothetical protein [Planctomycetaceae bacterium]